MVSRKEFIELVVDELKQNPRNVLRGHGMKQSILQSVSQREDVLAKLANVAYSTVYAPKATKSLVRQNNFQIFAYPNFNTLNGKARQDVEAFSKNLDATDQEVFEANENAITILMLPDTQKTQSLEDNIALGKSVSLKFDSAVTKEYKVQGGSYLVVVWGDSAIRKNEIAKAEAKASVNEKKVERTKSPQKIKAALVAKSKQKLAKINKTNFKLKNKAAIAEAPLKEFDRYGRELGLAPGASAAQINAAQRNFNSRTTAGAGALKAARIDKIQREINTLGMNNRVLRKKALEATTAKARADINFAIRKNANKIEALKQSIGIYEDTSARTIKKRSEYLAEINNKIKANIAKGESISAATQRAIASLNLPQQQKTQLAQQIIEEVANGQFLPQAIQVAGQLQLPEQIVIQQTPVVQQLPVQTPVVQPKRRGRKPIQIDQNARVDVFGDNFVEAGLTNEEIASTSMPLLSRAKDKLSSVLSFL